MVDAAASGGADVGAAETRLRDPKQRRGHRQRYGVDRYVLTANSLRSRRTHNPYNGPCGRAIGARAAFAYADRTYAARSRYAIDNM